MPYAARVSVRFSPQQRDLLETAARDSHTTISDFIRRESVDAAKIELSDRSIVKTTTNKQEQFETGGNQPA